MGVNRSKKKSSIPIYAMVCILAINLTQVMSWSAGTAAAVILSWWMAYGTVVPYLLDEELDMWASGPIPAGGKRELARVFAFLIGLVAVIGSVLVAFGILRVPD